MSEEELVVIWSGEHRMWWRPGTSGYTSRFKRAGVYTRTEAEDVTRHCGPEKMISIIPLEEALREHHDTEPYDAGTVGALIEEQEGEPRAYLPVGGPLGGEYVLLEYPNGEEEAVPLMGSAVWGAIGDEPDEGDYMMPGG